MLQLNVVAMSEGCYNLVITLFLVNNLVIRLLQLSTFYMGMLYIPSIENKYISAADTLANPIIGTLLRRLATYLQLHLTNFLIQ